MMHEQIREAHGWLRQGEALKARQLLRQVLKAQPQAPEVLCLLAQAERKLQHHAEAVLLMKKCCALSPALTYREHLGLALLFSQLGSNMAPAMECFAAVLAAQPTAYESAMNLLGLAARNGMPGDMVRAVLPLLALPLNDAQRARLDAYLAIAAYLEHDLSRAAAHAQEALVRRAVAYDAQGKPLASDLVYLIIYAEFVSDLLAFRAAHPALYAPVVAAKRLHVVGESHCLAPAHLQVRGHGVVPHWQMGTKAYFLTAPVGESYQYGLLQMVRAIAPEEPMVLMFGEIDCRPSEGFMEHMLRDPAYDMQRGIEAVTQGYAAFAARLQRKRTGAAWLCGVPAPIRAVMAALPLAEHARFTGMIAAFNRSLAQAAQARGLRFLDIHAMTVGEGGWARDGVHLDAVHLSPALLHTALQACVE
ncbi:MAG: SGNH/GDSL hydrolase family protein [Pseudomonadota bacterium]